MPRGNLAGEVPGVLHDQTTLYVAAAVQLWFVNYISRSLLDKLLYVYVQHMQQLRHLCNFYIWQIMQYLYVCCNIMAPFIHYTWQNALQLNQKSFKSILCHVVNYKGNSFVIEPTLYHAALLMHLTLLMVQTDDCIYDCKLLKTGQQ